MSSGDDIEVGRTAYADNWTRIWAQGSFGDSMVLIAEPSLDNAPAGVFNGIIGVGWSGTNIPVTRATGGMGVIGKGGLSQGTGVLGLAGGASLIENGRGWLATGFGGVGVHGIGGSHPLPSWDETVPAGAGVIGEGGRRDEFSTRRLPHGPGVIGLGGRHPWPTELEAGGVGVYGQGADTEIRTINVDGVDVIAGPNAPGYGIVGRGGLFDPPQGPVGTGVVGLAGGRPVPPITQAGDAGVYGNGPVGVKGDSPDGIGVSGISNSGVGVSGHSTGNDGIVGNSGASGRSGVYGFHSLKEGTVFGVFGRCSSLQGAGVSGINESAGDAVSGFTKDGVAVRGTSAINDGVVGQTFGGDRSGVYGVNTWATTTTSIHPVGGTRSHYGVTGRADDESGIGVNGVSRSGIGVRGFGGQYGATFQGDLAPVRLLPEATPGAPTKGSHHVGELFVDSHGDLFFCKKSGIPGTWVKVA
jgi:hypothetical protein